MLTWIGTRTPRNSSSRITTRTGLYKRKYHVKALIQSIAFVGLVGAFGVYNVLTGTDGGAVHAADNADMHSLHRALDEAEMMTNNNNNNTDSTLIACSDLKKADPAWLTVFYGLGVLYMFLALAIVCDEFFVPALEEMSSVRRLNLSMDVAGATLMAAGGSAPELFTSLFGTFQQSEIGFGTIVGSAVFNVLFVIAMCALFSKEVLALTWWPLFRDSLFYAIGLAVLCIFVGVVSPEEIELWEALVLLSMYFMYIFIMWQNANIYKMITGKELVYPDDEDDESDDDDDNDGSADANKSKNNDSTRTTKEEEQEAEKCPSPEASSNAADMEGPAAAASAPTTMERQLSTNSLSSNRHLALPLQTDLIGNSSFRWQGTFRAGILKLLRDPHTWVETGGVGIVAKIAGDANFVFKQIDANGDGDIDKEELKELFTVLEAHVTESELEEVFAALDVNGDGVISFEEFNKWYTQSAELIRSQTRNVFDKMDVNESGTLDKDEIKALLQELDPHVTDEDVEAAIDDMYKSGSREEITFEEFEQWYEHSMIYERAKKAVEEDMEGVFESLKPPFGDGCLAWVQYVVVFPLVVFMAFTIPDVRRPGWGRWCYASFFLSIAWIGGFAYLMVTWAEVIGNTVGIPSVIMGLTVLAAGTSVPDLLSSVIVARRGSGDMAVSSSIGSNIFDILVGLPVPWIIFTSWPNGSDSIIIGSDNLVLSVLILIGMLAFVIGAVHCQGWKLTKALAGMMILFYLAFLAQAIIVEIPFQTCQ